ncbi:MAG: class I SAM-dependent methyltransferase [Myxococcota bacterium]
MLTVELERLGLRPGDWVLDAGCGGGRHSFGVLERRAHVVGIDLDFEGLALARAGIHERRASATEKVHGGVICGDVFALPFPDASFERVICAEVMEHVHDYRAAIRELVRVLKPHGRIGITIPTAITEHVYLRLTRSYFESPGGHIRIFRARQLARAMAEAGLRVTDVSFAHALHSPYWALRALLGLHDERPAPTRAFRRLLILATHSRFWRNLERMLNWVWPKSLVLYGEKVARGRR